MRILSCCNPNLNIPSDSESTGWWRRRCWATIRTWWRTCTATSPRIRWPGRGNDRKPAKQSGRINQKLSCILHDFRHSSFVYFMSMVKNLLEILLASVFLFYVEQCLDNYQSNHYYQPVCRVNSVCQLDAVNFSIFQKRLVRKWRRKWTTAA